MALKADSYLVITNSAGNEIELILEIHEALMRKS